MVAKTKNWEFEIVNPSHDAWVYLKDLSLLVLSSHASLVVIAEWAGTIRGFIQFVNAMEMPLAEWMKTGMVRASVKPVESSYWKMKTFNNCHCQVNLSLVEHAAKEKNILAFEAWIRGLPLISTAGALKDKFPGVRQLGVLPTNPAPFPSTNIITQQRDLIDKLMIEIIMKSKSSDNADELFKLNDELVNCTMSRGKLFHCLEAFQKINEECTAVNTDIGAIQEWINGKRKHDDVAERASV
jgi:hypothetical protein